jgi:hypothetical protein
MPKPASALVSDLTADFEPGRPFGLAFPDGDFGVAGLVFRAMPLL